MVLGIVSTLTFIHILSPVHTYYVYDETPNVGFVTDDKHISVISQDSTMGSKEPLPYSLSTYTAKYGPGRRFHSNARSGAYMVDSHFKVLKSPTSTKADQRVVKFNIDQIPRNTDAPVEQRKYVEESAGKTGEPKNYANPLTGLTGVSGYPNSGLPHTKPYSKVTKDHRDQYLINVHKTQVTSGQKVKFNGNQFANNRRDDSEVAAATVAQQKKLEEVHSPAKPKYNPINQKKLDRRHYDATEYKRDVVANSVLGTMLPNLMSLPIDKENFKSNGRVLDIPRIGGWEESVDVKPYALFYRISQDPGKRQFDNVQHFLNEDDSEIKTDNFADQVLQNAHSVQPTISPNSIKLRMKIKKYSNFRSH